MVTELLNASHQVASLQVGARIQRDLRLFPGVLHRSVPGTFVAKAISDLYGEAGLERPTSSTAPIRSEPRLHYYVTDMNDEVRDAQQVVMASRSKRYGSKLTSALSSVVVGQRSSA